MGRSTLDALALVLVAAGSLAASPAANIRDGRVALREGNTVRAVDYYRAALRTEPDSRKAQRGLQRSLDAMVEARIDEAERARTQGKLATAVFELRRAAQVCDQVKRFNVEPASLERLLTLLDEVTLEAADLEQEMAASARLESRWGAAVAHLEAMTNYRPERVLPDDEGLASVLMSWGSEESAQGAWREAASRHARAATYPGSLQEPAALEASRLLAALGQASLRAGACRQASTDFADAERLRRGSVGVELARTAQKCAKTGVEVVLSPSVKGEDERREGTATRGTLERTLIERGSRFLAVGDGHTAPRTLPGPDSAAMMAGPYVVTLDQISTRTRRDTPTVSYRMVASTSLYDCSYASASPWYGCRNDVVIRYPEYSEPWTGTMSVRYTVRDEASGEPILVGTARATSTVEVRWIGSFSEAVVTGRDPWANTYASSGVRMAPSYGKQLKVEDVRREGAIQLRTALASEAVDSMLPALLQAVDQEPVVRIMELAPPPQ